MQEFAPFYRGGKEQLQKDLNKFLKSPASNYNTAIGDLLPHGIVQVTGMPLLIFDPRYEWPLLYGSANADRRGGVIPVAYNGQVNACAHYDAVPITSTPSTTPPAHQSSSATHNKSNADIVKHTKRVGEVALVA